MANYLQINKKKFFRAIQKTPVHHSYLIGYDIYYITYCITYSWTSLLRGNYFKKGASIWSILLNPILRGGSLTKFVLKL